MTTSPEYKKFVPASEKIILPHSSRVYLLAATSAQLPIESFSQKDWQTLNSSAIVAGEAGRTCYDKSFLTPKDYLTRSLKHREITDGVINNTLESGHLSTRQHVHYLFGLEGISRYFIHQVLHSFPFHNSDQQSQRYVEMDSNAWVIPSSEFYQPLDELLAGYEELRSLLIPTAKQFILARFPDRKDVENDAEKKSQEIARYLLPLATTANLYHSVSALTLMRYHHLSQVYRCSEEAKSVIKSMVAAVCHIDPRFQEELKKPLSSSLSFPYDPDDAHIQSQRTQEILGGKSAKLDESYYLPETLANAIRLTLGTHFGKLNDVDAIALVLDPKNNKLLGDTLGSAVMDQLTQALNQVYLGATVRISHVSDSQLQRHRGFNHTQPLHLSIPKDLSDIYIPELLKHNSQALKIYLQVQEQNLLSIQALRSKGFAQNELAYLLTNATMFEKRISGPLLAWHHWLKIRTCLNAQEEIYQIAVQLAQELTKVHHIGGHFQKPAPCGVRIRAGLTPTCPEGKHYCGIPVWKQTIQNYPKRSI